MPVCVECNYIAGDHVFQSIAEKRAWIHERLRERYDRVLRAPTWEDAEMESLGPAMRGHVRAGMELKRLVTERLAWPEEPRKRPARRRRVKRWKPADTTLHGASFLKLELEPVEVGELAALVRVHGASPELTRNVMAAYERVAEQGDDRSRV